MIKSLTPREAKQIEKETDPEIREFAVALLAWLEESLPRMALLGIDPEPFVFERKSWRVTFCREGYSPKTMIPARGGSRLRPRLVLRKDAHDSSVQKVFTAAARSLHLAMGPTKARKLLSPMAQQYGLRLPPAKLK